MRGLRDGDGGVGEPSGSRPWNFANFAGVRSFEDAGGGLPVILAKAARIHRSRVYMPRTEPNVCLRLPNCSATDTIAK